MNLTCGQWSPSAGAGHFIWGDNLKDRVSGEAGAGRAAGRECLDRKGPGCWRRNGRGNRRYFEGSAYVRPGERGLDSQEASGRSATVTSQLSTGHFQWLLRGLGQKPESSPRPESCAPRAPASEPPSCLWAPQSAHRRAFLRLWASHLPSSCAGCPVLTGMEPTSCRDLGLHSCPLLKGIVPSVVLPSVHCTSLLPACV